LRSKVTNDAQKENGKWAGDGDPSLSGPQTTCQLGQFDESIINDGMQLCGPGMPVA